MTLPGLVILFWVFIFGSILSVIHSKLKQTVEKWYEHLQFGVVFAMMVAGSVLFAFLMSWVLSGLVVRV